MSKEPPSARRAGGFLIAASTLMAISRGAILIDASTLIGTSIGVAFGQPSIGVLAGTGFGSGLALLIWLKDRKG